MGALADVARPYLDRLTELPFVRSARLVEARGQGMPAGGAIRLSTPSGTVDLAVDLRRSHLSREAAEAILHTQKERPRGLLLAPVVGRELGNLFASHRVNFLDLAGNCFIELDGRYIARIQGQRPTRAAPEERLLRAPAQRVLFALLADDTLLSATTRSLADAAGGGSRQTAATLRAQLVRRGVVLKTRQGFHWAPGQRTQAIEMFVAGFAALRATLTIGRYRSRQRGPDEVERALAPHLGRISDWRWGGGAGAQRLTGLYRGDRTVLYVGATVPQKLLDRLPLVPDPAGDVTLVRAPGPRAFTGPDPAVVHPLLVYCDLLTEGHDRAREAAAEIRQRFLEEKPR